MNRVASLYQPVVILLSCVVLSSTAAAQSQGGGGGGGYNGGVGWCEIAYSMTYGDVYGSWTTITNNTGSPANFPITFHDACQHYVYGSTNATPSWRTGFTTLVDTVVGVDLSSPYHYMGPGASLQWRTKTQYDIGTNTFQYYPSSYATPTDTAQRQRWYFYEETESIEVVIL